MSIVAIIPARGGSKSIIKKNIKLLGGIPLIAYTIKTAKASGIFDKIIVSTDCYETREIAIRHGALVVMRPEEFATDQSPTEDALIHVLDELKRNDDYVPYAVCTLEPTSPLRSIETVQCAYKYFLTENFDSLLTITEERSAYWKKNGNRFETLFENQPRRRQERTPIYKEAGVIYITKTQLLRELRQVVCGNVYPLEVSHAEAIDINEPIDFLIAESILLKIQDE